MAGNETTGSGLPMLLEAARPRPALARHAGMAGFVSQLLAERGRPACECGSAEGAVGAYVRGAGMAIKRLPPGYRTSIVA